MVEEDPLARLCTGAGELNMLIPHSRPTVGQDDISAVADVLASGMIAQGERVREFENAVASYVGMKHAVAVNSGTSALHLALLSLGVGLGDEVIIPSYVCSSPYFATLHARAMPKIVDIDYEDLNISAETASESFSSRTKAIIVPHMFGNPAELDDLISLGIPVIEDCAQALGAEYKRKKAGSMGDLSVFSFYATKMITTGEGGMILTRDDSFYDKLVSLRDYDMKDLMPAKYNYKMTDFQAALGLSQLRKVDDFISARRRIAWYYNEQLSVYGVGIPMSFSHKDSVFFRYVLRLDKMTRIQQMMRKSGVVCERPVHMPLHRSLRGALCSNSDKAHEHVLSIPVYPSLTQEEMEYVTTRLGEILNTLSKGVG